jgi:hypothetical protein
MRFDDFTKRPAKPQRPLTYTESLQAKLDASMATKPDPKFTALEWAIMEGGGSLETENFADGKNPQDKGDSKRHGVPTKASVGTLRKVAKQGGRKGQLAHWMANMKAGRAKKK